MEISYVKLARVYQPVYVFVCVSQQIWWTMGALYCQVFEHVRIINPMLLGFFVQESEHGVPV